MNRRFNPKPPPTPYSSDESRSLLNSNLQLQRALGERIQSLSRLKEHNRTSAREVACSIATATATAAIGTAGDDFQSDDAGITGGISNHRVKELLDRRQQRQQQQCDAATPSGLSRTAAPAAPIPPHPSATSSKATGVRVKRKRPVETVSSKPTRAWQQNPNRKWHRTYFVDAEGSTPQPNNDVARRAAWLEDVTSSSLPPDILSYTCCNHNEESADDGCRNDESAQEGKCPIANSKKKTEAAGGDTDTRIINSSSRQQQRQARKKKHKAATSRRGNGLTAQQRVSVRTTFVESGGHPDWSRIIGTSGSADNTVGGAKATAWDCFKYIQKEASSLLLAASPASAHTAAGASRTPVHATNATVVAAAAASASSKKSSLPSQPWGRDEDSILLTAVLSLGPQFALTRDTVCNLARELFGDRSVKQIKKRANESLVNPNYRSTAVRWTDEEERMLVLLMKAYGHCPNPLVKVFAHFPNVASKSVAEKWMRLKLTNKNNDNNNNNKLNS